MEGRKSCREYPWYYHIDYTGRRISRIFQGDVTTVSKKSHLGSNSLDGIRRDFEGHCKTENRDRSIKRGFWRRSVDFH